jgi:hypothetical protein
MPSTTGTDDDDAARLDEYDAVEWFDVCRRLKPDLTQERFNELWTEFQADKAARLQRQRLQ